MTPYSGLGFFFTLALALLPAAIAGLRGKNLRVCGALVTAVMLLLTIILLLFPIYWMVICSLMPTHYLTVLPPHFVPVDITLDNYIQIAQTPKYVAYFRNSVIVAVGTVLTTLVLSVPAGYAFSRYRFRGKSALLSAVMSVQMFPIVVILASLYIFYTKLGLLSSYPGLILSDTTFALPLAVTLVKSFFDTVPKSLDESARIDGASNARVLWSIIMPLSKPVYSVVILNTFMACYNQFIFPLILLPDSKNWTIMVRIYAIQGTGSATWNQIMVLLGCATVPVLICYIAAQKYIVQGISMSGLKG